MDGRLFFYIRTPQLPSNKCARADKIDRVGKELKNARYWSFKDGCNWLPDLVKDRCNWLPNLVSQHLTNPIYGSIGWRG